MNPSDPCLSAGCVPVVAVAVGILSPVSVSHDLNNHLINKFNFEKF